MGLFHIIDGAVAILGSNGVYKQTKVYHRDGVIYAGHAGGFVRLYAAQRGTSAPKVYLDAVELPFAHGKGDFGYMTLPADWKPARVEAPTAKQIEHKPATKKAKK